ncbi:hypothetical protein HZH68_012739 [Vespula germanica]|uniref:Uncharacterized protein n=1 Tax=Vespula germanica TaxID=30212 RepID=A0A834MVN2_VESGE|nr:hypothetical protein HZH68_012739 [Vespula germanica]
MVVYVPCLRSSDVTTARDPEFVSEIGNITVPAGRNVKLACSVKDLGTFKALRYLHLLHCKYSREIIVHLMTTKLQRTFAFRCHKCLTINTVKENNMDTVNMIQVLELLLGKLTTELEQTDGRVQWVGKGGGGGGGEGGWLRVVCSSSTKLWGRNKLDVVKFTTAKETNAKINNSITRGVPVRSTFSSELSVVNRSSVSVDRRVIGSDISGCYALRAAVGYNEVARFRELQSDGLEPTLGSNKSQFFTRTKESLT